MGSAFDTAGLNELQNLLKEDTTSLFQPILSNAFAPAVQQLSGQFATQFASLYAQSPSPSPAQRQAFLNNVVYQITNASGPLNGIMKNVTGAPGQANTILGQVNQTVNDVEKDANQFVQMLTPDQNGNYHTISDTIMNLLSDQSTAAGYLSSQLSGLDSVVSGLGPTFADLKGEFSNVTNQLNMVHQELTNGNSDISQAIGELTNDTSSVELFLQLAADNVSNLLSSAFTPAGDYFSASPAAAQAAIEQQLVNGFQNSPLCSDYQSIIRQFLSDDNATLDELMDDTFDQIGTAIRDALGNAVSSLDTNFDYGNISSVGCAKIRGSPTFNGDSLRKIHLNFYTQLNIPGSNSMHFNAYMEIKELTSQTVPADCVPQGAPAAEVTLGAKRVNLAWLEINDSGTPLYLTVAAKWTLQDSGSGTKVIGLGGLFDIKGQIGFEGCSINELAASLYIGTNPFEIYLATKAAGTINILGVPVGVQVGVFVGKACSLQPLLFIDPLAADVLNNISSFEGIYVEGSASISLSEILFQTSSCMLDVGLTESTAVFYGGNWPMITVGGRETTQVEASVLCMISASASLTMYDDYTFDLDNPTVFSVTMGGVAQVCGSIGPCPFCIHGCKGLDISATLGTGGVSYSLSD